MAQLESIVEPRIVDKTRRLIVAFINSRQPLLTPCNNAKTLLRGRAHLTETSCLSRILNKKFTDFRRAEFPRETLIKLIAPTYLALLFDQESIIYFSIIIFSMLKFSILMFLTLGFFEICIRIIFLNQFKCIFIMSTVMIYLRILS